LQNTERAAIEAGFDKLPTAATFKTRNIWYAIAGAAEINSYTATLFPTPTAYSKGMRVDLEVQNTNTGAVSFNANGLGAKQVVDATGTAFSSGGFPSGKIHRLIYDGTKFVADASVSTVTPGAATVTVDALASSVYASQAEAEAGTENTKIVTPLRVAQAITALGGGDMLAATYDPTNVAGDAFDQDNMVDGATNKNFTATEQTKLAGIETAATADQTAAEILTAVKTVDGTGSGLDADLLDGNEAAAFVPVSDFTADGDFLVGTGSGTYAAESGATARASLGVSIGLQTIFIPASAMVPAITSGPAVAQLESTTNKQNQIVLDFDGTAAEYAHFTATIPRSWNEGAVYYYVVWRSSATDTDSVAWFLQGAAMSDGDSTDPSWGTAVEVDDAAQSSATKVYVSGIPGLLTIGGTPAPDDIVAFRIYRDPTDVADTMTEDARLIGVVLFYNTNALRDD